MISLRMLPMQHTLRRRSWTCVRFATWPGALLFMASCIFDSLNEFSWDGPSVRAKKISFKIQSETSQNSEKTVKKDVEVLG